MRELSLHILDVVQNAVAAKAKNIGIHIMECKKDDYLLITIRDDGKGMSQDQVEKVMDPFFTSRTTRRVGLGMPMLKATAQACEGDVTVESAVGQGTEIRADFKMSHIDLPPLGNMISTLTTLILGSPNINFIYDHSTDTNNFYFTTAEMKEVLGDLPFGHPEVLKWLQDFLTEGENSLK
jgi:hypothetical protein